MRHVRNVKYKKRDENNNIRDETDNYNNNYSDDYELLPFLYVMSDFIDIHNSLSRRGDTYNSSPPNNVTV